MWRTDIPPFTIANSILSHVASISEKVGRVTVMSNMENKLPANAVHYKRNLLAVCLWQFYSDPFSSGGFFQWNNG